MSKIVFILPFLFVAITLAAAAYEYDQYGQYGPSMGNHYGGKAGYGGSGYSSGGDSYGRKRREIPSEQQQQQPQPGQPQPQASAQKQPGQQQPQQPQFQPVRGPKKFSVNVNDGIQGANQLRKETWDNGTVTGMYANPLGNKKYQIINYIADDKGYRILSTKVVDETELAKLGGENKFSPQSGKSAQIDITNDGNTASWTVTPDQINQLKQGVKTQPEGRSTKDKDMKDDKDKDADDKQQDDAEKKKHKQGKRSVDDMDMTKTMDDQQNDQPQPQHPMKQEGKRGRRGMMDNHGMGGNMMGHGMGGNMMGHGMGGNRMGGEHGMGMGGMGMHGNDMDHMG